MRRSLLGREAQKKTGGCKDPKTGKLVFEK